MELCYENVINDNQRGMPIRKIKLSQSFSSVFYIGRHCEEFFHGMITEAASSKMGWRGLCGRGSPGLVMGPCIVEIDRIAISEVQYQLKVNRCRNEEVIVKGNFGWVWHIRGLCGRGAPGLVMGPCIVEIDRIFIRDDQNQYEVKRCRNEEVNFQGSSANSVGEESGQDGRTERGDQYNISTLLKAWG
ncbi:hypothetical protein DPMN_162882 [Dreissena polymorpha]|uniref:Uncharacterized protein n=1 Tax=Dreissena polymorpha TaxID=45954 RepID=A0A9D4EUS1_DREPO|nr:hypothetical protein DPMN_162882 [Dreissena polymorpha]